MSLLIAELTRNFSRDDTDKYQWFTDGDLWFKCGDEVCNEGRKIHKATVNELIEHFKTKEE